MKIRHTLTRITAWLVCLCMLAGQNTPVLAAINLPSSLVTLEGDVFRADESITGLVVLSDTLTEVGANAFSGTGLYALETAEKTLTLHAQGLTSYAYLYVHGESTVVSDSDLAGANYVFAPAGSRVHTQCAANGYPFVDSASLLLSDGFYYQISGSEATLLCARDATTLSSSLTIPAAVEGASVTRISDSAFFGCGALLSLSLPYGVAVSEAAFSNCPNASVSYHTQPLSATLCRADSALTTAYVGDTAVWSINMTGGAAPYKVKFSVYCDDLLISSGSYIEATGYSYSFPIEGEYVIEATVRDSAFDTFTVRSDAITVSQLMAQIESVSKDIDTNTPLRNTRVTWTVTPAAGLAPYQYAFTLKRDGVNYATQAYSDSAAFSAELADAGSYVLTVRMKDANNTVALHEAPVICVLPPQLNRFIVSPETPCTEQEITWTADLSDVLDPYICTITLSDGPTTLKTVTGTSLSYTFTEPGGYTLSGQITDPDGNLVSGYSFQPIIALRPIEITGVSASPGEALYPDESIDFTATLSDVLGQYHLIYSLTDENGTLLATKTISDAQTPFTYTFAQTGDYQLDVSVVRYASDPASVLSHLTASYTVVTPPLSVGSISGSVLTAFTGDPITWTAQGHGGDGVYEYAFLLRCGEAEMDWRAYEAGNTYTYTPLDAGEYTLEAYVRDGQGTIASALAQSVTVTQRPLAITAFTADTDVAPGETASFTLQAEGGRLPLAYSFEVIDVQTQEQIALQAFSTDNTFDFIPDTAGDYTVSATVRDGAGETLTQSVTLFAYDPIAITGLTVDPAEVYVDEISTFTALAEGGKQPYAYTFDVYCSDGGPFWQQETSDQSLAVFRPNIADTYTVTVTVADARGETRSHSEMLCVYTPLTATLCSNGDDAPMGDPVLYTLKTSGGKSPVTYTLTAISPDGAIVPGLLTDNTLSFTPDAPGDYTVSASVTDALGTEIARSHTLSVYRPLESVSISTDPASSGIYTGECVKVFLTPDGGPESLLYEFTVTDETGSIVAHQLPGAENVFAYIPRTAGTYLVTGTIDALSASCPIYVYDPLTDADLAAAAQDVVLGDPVQASFLSVTGGIKPYAYAFEARNAQGDVIAEQDFDAENGSAFTFSPAVSGEYTLSGTVRDARENTVTVTETVRVHEKMKIAEASADLTQLVIGESVDFTLTAENGVQPLTYRFEVFYHEEDFVYAQQEGAESAFSLYGDRPGQYTATLSVTDAIGQYDSCQYIITYYESNITAFYAAEPSIRLGETALLTANHIGGKNPAFSFRALDASGNSVAAQDASSVNTFAFTPAAPGDYTVYCTITDSFVTQLETYASIHVYESMTLDTLAANVAEIRAENDVNWTVNRNDGHANVTYTWNVMRDGVTEATIETLTPALVYAPLDMGVYTVEVTANDGVETAMISGAPVNVLRAYTPLSDLAFATYFGAYGVTRYMGSDAHIVIPETGPNGNPITAIHANAFKGKTGIVSVELPDTITYLGQNAFGSCSNLTSIQLPPKWTLTEFSAESANITTGPFAGTAIEHITVPSTMTFIPKAAFGGMANLKSVTLHDGITSIGNFAFNYCSNLTDVTLPDSITALGARAFYGCASLTSINYPPKLERVYVGISGSSYNYIYEGPFSGSGITSVTVPEGVSALPDYVLSDMLAVESISLPASLTSIGTDALDNCPALREITLAGGNTGFVIHDGALMNAAKTTLYCYPKSRAGSFTLPETITSISAGQFMNCSKLESVTLHDGVTHISNGAFMDCSRLERIRIPEGITTILVDTFSGCSALESVSLPSTLETIGPRAFKSCVSLSTLAIPSGVTNIFDDAFDGCTNLTIRCESGSAAHTHALKYGIPCITAAGVADFNYSTSSSSAGSFCTIDEYVGSSAVVIIPESIEGVPVTAIGANAFKDNTTVTEIYIPEGVKSFGSLAFANCTSLSLVHLPSTLTGFQTNAITNTPADLLFYGPSDFYSADYAARTGRLFLACSLNSTEWTITEGGSYTLTNQTLRIPDMLAGYPVTAIDAHALRADTGDFAMSGVIIPDSVKTIGEYAFYACTTLTDVTLPCRVKSIGTQAFGGCTALTSITLPDSWKEVTSSASGYIRTGPFANTNITHVTIPAGMTAIPNAAFAQMRKLTSVTMHDAIESIGDFAFCYTALTSVTLPESLRELGGAAFAGAGLTRITLPQGVTAVAHSAFSGCRSLVEVTLPESVTRIDDNAFDMCYALEQIHIPENVTYIGDYAFQLCSALNLSLVIPANTVLGDHPFIDCGENLVLFVAKDSPAHTYAQNNAIAHVVYELYTQTQTADICAVSLPETMTEITLPDSILGYPVTHLSMGLFSGCAALQRVTLPENLTAIPNNLFYGCTLLTDVAIPETVTSIGAYAFHSCSALTDIAIPETVTSIGSYAFFGCAALTEIVIPEAVTGIGAYAFSGCAALTRVTLPAELTRLSDGIFCKCAALTQITLPAGVTSIPDEAFYLCTSLKTVTLPDALTSIGYSAFEECPLDAIDMPDSVETIDNYAFYECNLDALTLPASLTTIGDYAFESNYLTEVVIPENVTCIGESAFYSNRALSTVVIPESVTDIGADAFAYCSDDLVIYCKESSAAHTYAVDNSLSFALYSYNVLDNTSSIHAYTGTAQHITLPAVLENAPVTRLGESVFKNNLDLESVALGENLREIGSSAFEGCQLLAQVSMPAALDSIDAYAFKDCLSLSAIVIPEGVATLEFGVFYGCTLLTDVSLPTTLTALSDSVFAHCTSLTHFTIPDTVTTMGSSVFANCTGLTRAVLPEGLKTLSASTFYFCSALEEVTLPSTLTAIDRAAFYYCRKLASLEIPPLVRSIGENALGYLPITSLTLPEGLVTLEKNVLSYCQSLTSLTIPDGVKIINTYALSSCTALRSVFIPDSVVSIAQDAFLNTTGATLYCTEGSAAHTYAVDNSLSFVLYSVDAQTQGASLLSAQGVSGAYAVPETLGGCPVTAIGDSAFKDNTALTSVTLPASITRIENYAFSGCTALQSVNFPEGLDFIGWQSFMNCAALTQITLPDSLTRLVDQAFNGCTSLASVTLGENLTTLERMTFYGCTALREIVVPERVTTLDVAVFSGCTALSSVTLPASLTAINQSAFYGCTSLASVTLPDTLTTLGNDAFNGCTALSSITIPDGITEVADWCFNSCTALTSVTLPESITSINFCAFSGCSSLAEIDIPDSVTFIGQSAFSSCYALTSITLPASLKTIDCAAFIDCPFTQITFPASLETIGEMAFGYNRFTHLTIPGTVKTIGNYAFYGCYSLQSVVMEAGVQTLGTHVFIRCSVLDSVTIPASVTSLGEKIFEDCPGDLMIQCTEGSAAHTYAIENNLLYNTTQPTDFTYTLSNGACTINSYTGSAAQVIIPDTIENTPVTALGANVFTGKTTLEHVIVPDTVKEIGSRTFANCPALSRVYLPAGITYDFEYGLGDFDDAYPFANCLGSKLIVYGPYDATVSDMVGHYNHTYLPFQSVDGGVEIVNGATVYSHYSFTALTIPASLGQYRVVSIGANAFSEELTYIKHVSIPEGVMTIGSEAFFRSEYLETISLPTSVNLIGERAFGSCAKLREVDLPPYLSEVSPYLFTGCSALERVSMPENLYAIGSYAFWSCSSLTDIALPASLETIGDYAFCLSGLKNIFLPDSVTTLGQTPFPVHAPGSVVYAAENSAAQTACSGASELSCVIYRLDAAAQTAEIVSCLCSLTSTTIAFSITLPDSIGGYPVTSIGFGAFKNCALYRSITLPSSVTDIAGDAFYRCSGLTSITLPESVTSIGDYAFMECTALSEVTFEEGRTVFDAYCPFYGCTALTSVKLPESLTALRGYAFGHADALARICIPASVTEIGANVFYVCPETLTIHCTDGSDAHAYALEKGFAFDFTAF